MGRRLHDRDRQGPADELLMARYAEGDLGAFEDLFRRYERRAYAFFLKRTGSPERAQDLYQELFYRIHRGRDRYDPDRPFPPWFFEIAHRLLSDDRRRAHRSREVPIEDRDPCAEEQGAEACLADREQLAQLLAGLSPEERYVLVSSKALGIGHAELARQLGRSVAAVKKLASRAVQRVRAGGLVSAGMYPR